MIKPKARYCRYHWFWRLIGIEGEGYWVVSLGCWTGRGATLELAYMRWVANSPTWHAYTLNVTTC